eukprot:c12869_g1_i1 orf=419-2167(-)
MVPVVLHHCSCSSSQGRIPDVFASHLLRCSSTRAAAPAFQLRGFGSSGYGLCLSLKHKNAKCGFKVEANLAVESRSVFSDEATGIAADAIARARAAKAAAVALAQDRANEAASVVALARAVAQCAKDLAVLAHDNSWHDDFPSEADLLLLERARLSEMEHNNLFDVVEESMSEDDELQGTVFSNGQASSSSLDSACAMHGLRRPGEDGPMTPSDRKVPIAARSSRRDERLAKRTRAHAKYTKAAAVAAAALAAPPSKQGKSKKSSNPIRLFLATNGIKRQRLLTATEEVQLSRKVQDVLALEAVRSSLQKQLGREPFLAEWAGAVDMALGPFSTRLSEGRLSKDRMIQSNLRLVVSVAKKYQGRGLNIEDLVQAGSVGLIRGCERFDPEKGFKFSTYAHYWIRQGITRMIAEQARTVRLPSHLSEAMARIRKAKRTLFQEYQRPPCEKDVAQLLGMTVEKLRSICRSSKGCKSLDKLLGENMDTTLGELIADETIEHPELRIGKQLLKQDVNRVLKTLSEREMDVVRLRFGFDGGKIKTLAEIGQKYNVTRERVRQIESKAMQKLKQPDRNNVLKDYVYDIL